MMSPRSLRRPAAPRRGFPRVASFPLLPPQLTRLACGITLLLGAAACHRGGMRPGDDPAAEAMRAAWRQRAVTDSVQQVLARGLADSAFPAAFAVVGSARGVYAAVGVGSLDPPPMPVLAGAGNGAPAGVQRQGAPAMPAVPVFDPAASRVTDSTVWDLASLTKVVATTSAVLQLVADGRVALDTPVVRYLPRWTAPNAGLVSVRHLLTHSAGLPAWRPLYKEAWSAEEAMAQVYATGPDTVPGARYVYSDLGFILLGELVQQMTALPLDSYVLAHVFLPMGMRETRFHPPALWRSRTALTEIDPWRQRHLRGEVHDENSFQLGAVSGHAGLFSTARDLTRFAQTLLRTAWPLEGTPSPDLPPVLDGATLRAFTERQPHAGSHRALGWETPTGSNSAGRRLGARAFGHTGFTGTSLWIDPDQDLFVLLLTNRVNPTRQRQGVGPVRMALADAVVGALEATAGPAGRTPEGNLE